jgi:hypothetical protein
MKERNENGLDNIVPSLPLFFLPVKANCHLQRKSTWSATTITTQPPTSSAKEFHCEIEPT